VFLCSTTRWGLTPIFVLPIGNDFIFAKRISPVIPRFTTGWDVFAAGSFMLLNPWKDTLIELLDCLFPSHYATKITCHELLSFLDCFYMYYLTYRCVCQELFSFFCVFFLHTLILFISMRASGASFVTPFSFINFLINFNSSLRLILSSVLSFLFNINGDDFLVGLEVRTSRIFLCSHPHPLTL